MFKQKKKIFQSKSNHIFIFQFLYSSPQTKETTNTWGILLHNNDKSQHQWIKKVTLPQKLKSQLRINFTGIQVQENLQDFVKSLIRLSAKVVLNLKNITKKALSTAPLF